MNIQRFYGAIASLLVVGTICASVSAQLKVVAFSGSAAPSLPGVNFTSFAAPTLNNVGSTAFPAYLNGPGISPAFNGSALYLVTNDVPQFVAQQSKPGSPNPMAHSSCSRYRISLCQASLQSGASCPPTT